MPLTRMPLLLGGVYFQGKMIQFDKCGEAFFPCLVSFLAKLTPQGVQSLHGKVWFSYFYHWKLTRLHTSTEFIPEKGGADPRPKTIPKRHFQLTLTGKRHWKQALFRRQVGRK